MIYIITDHGVKSGRTLKELNKKYGILVDASEVHGLGCDQVVYMTDKNIDFVEDKAKVSSIMFSNFFKRDNTGKIVGLVNLILTALILFTK